MALVVKSLEAVPLKFISPQLILDKFLIAREPSNKELVCNEIRVMLIGHSIPFPYNLLGCAHGVCNGKGME